MKTNENALPIAYLYENAISEATYIDSSFVQRESLQMANAITDDIEALNIFLDDYAGSFEIECDISNRNTNCIFVDDTSKPVHIDADVPANGFLYISIYGLEYNREKECENVIISAECEDKHSNQVHMTPENIYYFGNRDYIFNLGYSHDDRKGIDLFFDRQGEYKFKNIKVEFVPYSYFEEQLQKRKEESVDNIVYSKNSIVLQTSNAKEKILFLSIPYTSGWEIKIDGNVERTFRTGIMGIGCVIPAGEHNITLDYTTPGLLYGLILGVIGGILQIILIRTSVIVCEDGIRA